jgi:16S rRNA (cytosine1402-N4)-methyltransferase
MAHIPVLTDDILNALIPDPDNPPGRVIDGTLGAGGHTRALLEAGVGQVLAFDVDTQAIQLAEKTLADYTDRVHIVHDSYANMTQHAQQRGWFAVDGILLDLGLSSMQLDTPQRGFAFKHDGPLDMRFDKQRQPLTAAMIVNQWDADNMADIFYKYGEERHSRKIAQDIVNARPFETTQQLADFIADVMPRAYKSRIHPATRIFQALRIAVNDELGTIERTLPEAIDLLRPGGRLAVISFHSLEDRIVKQTFKEAAEEIVAPPGMASIEEKEAIIKLINRKPITPDDAEMQQNPRSRSSKLRIAEKL